MTRQHNPGSFVVARPRLSAHAVSVSVFLLMLGQVGSVSVAVADEAGDQLEFNPFRADAVPAAPANTEPAGRSRRETEFVPVLQSTMVGQSASLANLGGVLLAEGEEAHGYRLIEVDPFGATFLKNGTRIRLEVESRERAGR